MLDMTKFWGTLKEAVAELDGKNVTENPPICGNGNARWPNQIKTATIHGTPHGDVRMHRVDCYGWCRSQY